MLNKPKILSLLQKLNAKLKKSECKGEVCLCGGAVMCLVFDVRQSTKDIDAVFAPTDAIRKAISQIAYEENLAADWLNDAAKAYFLADPPRILILELSHLNVWAPRADYMLAMKSISARFDTHDRDDVIFLLKHLQLKNVEDVFDVIEKYYPKKMIPTKTRFFLEEILEDKTCG